MPRCPLIHYNTIEEGKAAKSLPWWRQAFSTWLSEFDSISSPAFQFPPSLIWALLTPFCSQKLTTAGSAVGPLVVEDLGSAMYWMYCTEDGLHKFCRVLVSSWILLLDPDLYVLRQGTNVWLQDPNFAYFPHRPHSFLEEVF